MAVRRRSEVGRAVEPKAENDEPEDFCEVQARRADEKYLAPSARSSYEGETVKVTLGKQLYSTAPYCSFEVGPFETTAILQPGEDRVRVASEMLAELRALAKGVFDTQLEDHKSSRKAIAGEVGR